MRVSAATLAAGSASTVAFAGWRLGRGDIPVYDGKLATTDAGEIRAGIELPVLRDAAIDGPRAQRKRTDVEVDIATLEREQRALELSRDAAIALRVRDTVSRQEPTMRASSGSRRTATSACAGRPPRATSRRSSCSTMRG